MANLGRGVCETCGEEKPIISALYPDPDGIPRMTQIVRNHKATRLEWVDRKTWYCLGGRKPPTKITSEAG